MAPKKIRKPEEEVEFEEPNKHLVAFVKEQVNEYLKVNDITGITPAEKAEWVETVLNISEDTITVLIESVVDATEPMDDDDDELGEEEEGEDG